MRKIVIIYIATHPSISHCCTTRKSVIIAIWKKRRANTRANKKGECRWSAPIDTLPSRFAHILWRVCESIRRAFTATTEALSVIEFQFDTLDYDGTKHQLTKNCTRPPFAFMLQIALNFHLFRWWWWAEWDEMGKLSNNIKMIVLVPLSIMHQFVVRERRRVLFK